LHDAGALDENLAHLGIDQIDVSHTIAQLDVSHAVELFWHGQQILGEKRQILNVNAEFAGPRAEEIALDADMVSNIEELVKLPKLVAYGIFSDIDLELLARLLEVGEAGFTHQADRNQASSDSDRDALGLKLLASAG
jgi:hypothetical protein